MHRIQCRTLFDITRTDVRHQFNQSQLPFQDASGQQITNHRTWMLARNQQRNWETVLQILGLRVQPEEVGRPRRAPGDDWWGFDFAVADAGGLALDGREYGQLEQDATMVPMLIGLTESVKITPMLIPGINIVFAVNTQS
jgi:hypothetical protein